ncbi:hypothetical protein [Geodermatophilus ruber]|uniref:Uncharacterized protein n=1 Tax=Geodermatophilus ruber TaxID=504800 RepID=A0A1I3YUZ9_9ACTN|nr:hypothetical protein [Geodermatophilus ruber]SFK35615.1 hypothetical protein SAMN04488085_101213 [Geodermatophilus ruber]
MQFAGRPVEIDVSAGAWIAEAVRPLGEHVVGGLVPPVFAAYARVFHPAARYDGLVDVDVAWAEVAAANGTRAHPAMEWGSITGAMEFFEAADQSPLWDGAPARGHLPETVAHRLAGVLARHTTTPADCLFGVWSGFAELVADHPTLALPGREHWLVRGPIGLAAANLAREPAEQSANLWWPADRAWFVATDIDLVTTYVGGSRACVDELLAAEGLEAAEVLPTQRINWDADTLNPLPLDGPA